jgi:hypothetical protein
MVLSVRFGSKKTDSSGTAALGAKRTFGQTAMSAKCPDIASWLRHHQSSLSAAAFPRYYRNYLFSLNASRLDDRPPHSLSRGNRSMIFGSI